MSSTDDTRPPRRPQPDRDSFYDQHARNPAPVTGDKAGEKAGAENDETVLPETVILSDGDALPTVQINQGEPEPEPAAKAEAKAPRSSATRTDVRSGSDAVVTEPFVDVDEDATDETAAAQKRRAAEHLTADPLPYIEPQYTGQHTAPFAADEEILPSEPAAAYSEVPGGVHHYDDEPATAVAVAESARRGTVDLGLLILRVVVGLVFFFHGLQKLTTWSWIDGSGIDGFSAFLANNAAGADAALGFDPDVTRTLAIVGGISETVGGALLILGLLTPIAGSAVLGVIIVAMTYKATLAGGVWFFTAQGGGGIEFEIVLAAAAIALILCGPGTYSIDRQWGWSRRPAWGSAAWLIIAVAAAIAIWIVFNGANPLAAT
ncbi:DoxX family protein [Gordonia caeni]|uniref:DoxX family membrane protein n=1 Tax=Gordonia caeni TaxID=1007097 RepID=A0ABP7NZY0_9ACTN